MRSLVAHRGARVCFDTMCNTSPGRVRSEGEKAGLSPLTMGLCAIYSKHGEVKLGPSRHSSSSFSLYSLALLGLSWLSFERLSLFLFYFFFGKITKQFICVAVLPVLPDVHTFFLYEKVSRVKKWGDFVRIILLLLTFLLPLRPLSEMDGEGGAGQTTRRNFPILIAFFSSRLRWWWRRKCRGRKRCADLLSFILLYTFLAGVFLLVSQPIDQYG